MAHFRAFYCMSMRMGESDQKPDKPCFYELNRGNGQEWIIPTKSRALHLASPKPALPRTVVNKFSSTTEVITFRFAKTWAGVHSNH